MRGYRFFSFPVVMIAILAGCSQDPPDGAPRQQDPRAGPPRQIDCATLNENPGAYAGSRVIVYASQEKSEMAMNGGGILSTTLWHCSGADGAAGSGALFMTSRTGRDVHSLTGETWGAGTRTANVFETLFRITGTARNGATHHFNTGDVSALMIEQAQIELANRAQENGTGTAPN